MHAHADNFYAVFPSTEAAVRAALQVLLHFAPAQRYSQSSRRQNTIVVCTHTLTAQVKAALDVHNKGRDADDKVGCV